MVVVVVVIVVVVVVAVVRLSASRRDAAVLGRPSVDHDDDHGDDHDFDQDHEHDHDHDHGASEGRPIDEEPPSASPGGEAWEGLVIYRSGAPTSLESLAVLEALPAVDGTVAGRLERD